MNDSDVDEDITGMVRACRPEWAIRDVERSDYGTDLVCFVTCETSEGRREAVLKATTADFVEPEIARSEPRLFAFIGRETDIPVPDVYGYVDSHAEYPAPFYLVERRPGENFEDRVDELLPAARDRVVAEAGRNLAALHEIGTLPRVGRVGVRDGELAILDDHYGHCEDFREWVRAHVEDSLDALADGTYFPDLADEPDRFADLVPELREVCEEHLETLPDPDPPTYCHWDYRYGNLLVAPETGDTEAVLDWANLLSGDPAYNLAAVEAHLLDPCGDDSAERVAELRSAFREHYAEPRENWTFDAAVERRIETYLLACRVDAMAAMPLWYENASPEGRDERAAVHRAFLENYL